MKATYLVPTRNKIAAIERCARSVLGQTARGDIEVLFFDQGSTDGTFERIGELITEYPGVDAIAARCPPAEPAHGGTNIGINADFHWAIGRTTGDLIMFTCADDYAEPQRAERLLAAFADHRPSWLGARQRVIGIGGAIGETWFPDRTTRWIAPAEAIRYQVGSSGGLAFSRECYARFGPMRGLESNDIVLPVLALFDRGMYFVDEILSTYVESADLSNLGLEGKLRAARSADERAQLVELNAYMNAQNWSAVYRRLGEHGLLGRLSGDATSALLEKVIGCGANWADARLALDQAAIRPIGLKTLGG